MHMPSLASSLGWKLSRPSGIQRRAPLTPLPTCGTSTVSSSIIASAKIHGAHFSQTAIGTCTVASAHTMPMPMKAAWRVRKCVDE
jgi:hypothetical protein